MLEHVVIQSVPYSAGRQWQFLGSLYFSTVVINTIEYAVIQHRRQWQAAFSACFMHLVEFHWAWSRSNQLENASTTAFGKDFNDWMD